MPLLSTLCYFSGLCTQAETRSQQLAAREAQLVAEHASMAASLHQSQQLAAHVSFDSVIVKCGCTAAVSAAAAAAAAAAH